MAPSRLQQARADETRQALLRAARELFTEQGYAQTSTEQLVQHAGVTRGALYHHFESKQALFEAVFLELEGEFGAIAARVMSPDVSAWDNLVAGCHAYLDMCLRPDVGRIVLLDGPAVLGPGRWREIEDQYALAGILVGVQVAMAEGVVAPRPAVPLARLVLAAINEAALYIAQSDHPRVARREAGETFDALLAGLRA
ncbi:MAG TPA: helix-turn-helix domain-containing protein [Acidimicrobiales bacterium]|nr:helix-turn-helix domain-containing protein [Acidimicrobiales bacterium]